MEEIGLWSWGAVVIGFLLLIYIIKNKKMLKRTILRRLTSGEED